MTPIVLLSPAAINQLRPCFPGSGGWRLKAFQNLTTFFFNSLKNQWSDSFRKINFPIHTKSVPPPKLTCLRVPQSCWLKSPAVVSIFKLRFPKIEPQWYGWVAKIPRNQRNDVKPPTIEREFGNETRPGSMSIFITANLNTFGFSCLSAARIELEGGTTFVEILLCPIDWSDSIRGWCVITFRRIAAGFSSVLGLLKEQRPRNKSGEKLV